jgi:hypothetical protein
MTKELFSVDKDVFSVGTHNGKYFGPEVIDDMIKNFSTLKEKDPSFKVPLKLDIFQGAIEEAKADKRLHAGAPGGVPAFGFVDSLQKVGEKLVAHIVNVPRKLKDIIDAKGYRQVSIEMVQNFSSGAERLGNVLKGVALLGVDNPGCKNLDEVWRFYGQEPIADEVLHVFVVEDNFKEEGTMTPQEEQKLRDDLAKAEKDAKDFKAANESLTSELSTVKTTAAAATQKATELADGQRKADIQHFMDVQKKEGRILPKHEQAILAVFNSLDDSVTVEFALADGKKENKSVRKVFEEMIASMPKLIDFKEKSEKGEETSAFTAQSEEEAGPVERQELHFKATEYIKAHPGTLYRDALVAISKPEPKA